MKERADVSFASLQVSTRQQTNAPRLGQVFAPSCWREEAIHSLSSPHSLARTQAELWMTSRERRYVFAFAGICEALGLEPSAVRRSVIGLLDKKPTGRRLLPRSRPNVRHGGALQQSATRRGRSVA